MKNILLTGGAGYIGSHVAHLLIDKGYDVTVIDSLITGNKYLIPSKAKLEICDIAEVGKISKIIQNNNVSKHINLNENNTIRLLHELQNKLRFNK